MAIFTCYVPTSIFGGGFPPRFELTDGDGFFFQLTSQQFYEVFGGTFGYSGNGTPNGYVTAYGVYNNNDALTRLWNADGGLYDATDIYNLRESGSWRDFFKYMFYLNDEIYGSERKDKLNGYTGDDYIAGNGGNDKLKGGPGFDGFYFDAFDGVDTIKDFKWRKDTLWLDSSLATTFEEVRDAAFVYGKGIVLDFGSTVIKIEKLKTGDFDSVDIGFL